MDAEFAVLGHFPDKGQTQMVADLIELIIEALPQEDLKTGHFQSGVNLFNKVMTLFLERDREDPRVTLGDIDAASGDLIRIVSLHVTGKELDSDTDLHDTIYAAVHEELRSRVKEEVSFNVTLRVNPVELRQIVNDYDSPIEDVMEQYLGSCMHEPNVEVMGRVIPCRS